MESNPYRSPAPIASHRPTISPTSPWSWWESRRWHYNASLALAGFFAFLGYLGVCCVLLPRVRNGADIEITPFTTLIQGIGYLFAMGVANVIYFIGPLSETVLRPNDVGRYRQSCYRLGFGLSVLLPFGIPAWLTILVLFFPGYWKH